MLTLSEKGESWAHAVPSFSGTISHSTLEISPPDYIPYRLHNQTFHDSAAPVTCSWSFLLRIFCGGGCDQSQIHLLSFSSTLGKRCIYHDRYCSPMSPFSVPKLIILSPSHRFVHR